MKVKDLIVKLQGLDSETEILVGTPTDYFVICKRNSSLQIDTDVLDMSYDFENGISKKVLFLD